MWKWKVSKWGKQVRPHLGKAWKRKGKKLERSCFRRTLSGLWAEGRSKTACKRLRRQEGEETGGGPSRRGGQRWGPGLHSLKPSY